MRRGVLVALLGVLIVTLGTVTAAEDQKQVLNGPSKASFGGLQLVLGQGASAEAALQPDASKLVVKTLVGEARVVTSAKNLILVENIEGRVEILLPNGRLIVVEQGRAEIVGRTLAYDPGNVTIRLAGTGPIAQAAPPPLYLTTSAVIQIVSSFVPALLDTTFRPPSSTRFCGVDCTPARRPVSPTQ